MPGEFVPLIGLLVGGKELDDDGNGVRWGHGDGSGVDAK